MSGATAARTRLLAAAVECARRDGAGALTMQSIATEAGVSKALLLYHFRDKEDLLTRVVEWITARTLEREERALRESTALSVLEDLWRWLADEVQRGELLVLTELSRSNADALRGQIRSATEGRLQAAERTLERTFSLLGLRPRVPFVLLAQVQVAFVNGLSALAVQAPEQNQRVAFDVFWLSMLSLIE